MNSCDSYRPLFHAGHAHSSKSTGTSLAHFVGQVPVSFVYCFLFMNIQNNFSANSKSC